MGRWRRTVLWTGQLILSHLPCMLPQYLPTWKEPHMAVCHDCAREMTEADSCVPEAVLIAGVPHTRVRCREVDRGGRCGDCGARRGGLHHFGCDMERCPRCRWQLISCG